jgi:hypothetical protein
MRGDTVSEAAMQEQAAIIARQNDQFRAVLAFGAPTDIPGQVLFTPGVAAMGPEFMALLQLTVAGFADFNEDNDPHGDHSFAVVEVCGTRVFWKIDLYDEDYSFGSEAPTDPERTRRVLTMLLPSEY